MSDGSNKSYTRRPGVSQDGNDGKSRTPLGQSQGRVPMPGKRHAQTPQASADVDPLITETGGPMPKVNTKGLDLSSAEAGTS